MVHTRNGSSHSVQPDGPGQGRGKTRTRSAKSSSRKTHLEDARAAPHSLRSVPTNIDVNSEPELIEGNFLRAEPLSSGSHRNISVPKQKLVHSSKRRGVGNMPKPLAGGHELPLTHQELSGPEEGIGNDPRFVKRPSGIYQLQTSSINIQREAQRTSEEEKRSQEPSGQGQRQSKFTQTLSTRVWDPQIGAFSHGQCLQYGQDSHGIHRQRAGKDEQDFFMQIINEIQFVKSSIDAKLKKITSDISELKRNDKNYTECYKLKNVRLDSITNTCDRIESKCQSQNDKMEDLFILNINYQLRIFKDHVLEIINNTNQFATHLAKSDSERQKLRNEIIENLGKNHKNYAPHIPRHSTSLTEEKLSVKGILTPFLGENPVCAKDIPKLEEWPTFSGEGEYNDIELIRTIYMLQVYFHIPD
ncbi:hypothetical protein O181_004012 [Austropuccinia psidii MF-1]|uniref:Uncharacterized protein n=1 Tax=Austropuccinia psidii MF-1 TaxID=1389203 RepID=A0A9Q3BFY3_9BASI|nr:hypothetical protein [Austropuccinia psidii MF-1]